MNLTQKIVSTSFLLVSLVSFNLKPSQANAVPDKWEKEAKAKEAEQNYAKEWHKPLKTRQQALCNRIFEVIPSFPKELAAMVATYEYEFTGKCIKTSTENSLYEGAETAILPDGSFAYPGSGNDIYIFRTWEDIAETLSGHTARVWALLTMRDGTLVSGGGADKTIKIWRLITNGDTQTWQCVETLTDHIGWVYCLAELPNGNLVSGDSDNYIKIWEKSVGTNGQVTWQCISTLKSENGGIRHLAILPNGNIASGTCNKDISGTVEIWAPKADDAGKTSWQCTHTLTGHPRFICYLKIEPNGQLVSGSDDGTMKFWE